MTDSEEGHPASQTAPTQSDEVRNKILANSSGGAQTATGVARDVHLNDQASSKQDLPGGSEIPIAGGDSITGDFAASEAKEPVGAQAQPASYATNGSLPLGMVASPSGPIPVSAVTSDPARALELQRQAIETQKNEVLRTSASGKLSRAKVESMSANDLRAVGYSRGYDLGDYAGSRQTRKRFLAAQAKDTSFDESEAEQSGAGEPSTEV